MSTWCVYIVRCVDGSLYTGISTDIDRRIQTHNQGKGAAYTRSHRPVVLVWRQAVRTESEARKQEACIKHLSKQQKEDFIRQHTGTNPL